MFTNSACYGYHISRLNLLVEEHEQVWMSFSVLGLYIARHIADEWAIDQLERCFETIGGCCCLLRNDAPTRFFEILDQIGLTQGRCVISNLQQRQHQRISSVLFGASMGWIEYST